jgi:hypothetical protein
VIINVGPNGKTVAQIRPDCEEGVASAEPPCAKLEPRRTNYGPIGVDEEKGREGVLRVQGRRLLVPASQDAAGACEYGIPTPLGSADRGVWLFSEASQVWRQVPRWVKYLIRLGYDWLRTESRPRRIALLSMPCDSAAAGLIALGALVADLANPNANDLGAHYEALLRFARQYLESCRDCRMRCDPDAKGCGHVGEATGWVRHRDGKRYRVIGISSQPAWGEAIVCSNSREQRYLIRAYAADWRIDGEPALQSDPDGLALAGAPYARMLDGAQIVPENLGRSFSGLCLAGRGSGETATREICGSIRFRCGNDEHALLGLLSVHGWSGSRGVSRISFFNPRTDRFDRYAGTPGLVVADGDASFLSVLRRKEFQRSDVIGVVHRTLERDRLEEVGNRMLDLRQWYGEEPEPAEQLPALPSGISISILRQRMS